MMLIMKYLLAIDPSIKALGWAVFNHEPTTGNDRLGEFCLDGSGVEKIGKSFEDEELKSLKWLPRVDEMVERVSNSSKMMMGVSRQVIIEMPSVYSGGKGTVASNSGAIVKLGFLVASIRSRFHALATPVELTLVKVWKGNTPKEITQKRVAEMLGKSRKELMEVMDHNEVDAIGLGRWWFRQRNAVYNARL